MPNEELLLMIPGPTNLPASVRRALAEPSMYHRGAEFAELMADCQVGLQACFGTTDPVLTLSASGTGGVEAAVANLIAPGERILTINSGKFGLRIGEIAQCYGAEVTWWDCRPGEAADPRLLRELLSESRFDALGFAYNETSTGVAQDLSGIAKAAAEHGVLTIVDAVSAIGGMPINMEANALDAVVGGSQKALMLPPGLSFVALSAGAQLKMKQITCGSYYFDLSRALDALDKGQTPYTPAVNLFSGLQESLRLIRAEGVAEVLRRHHCLGVACRAASIALGLELLAADERRASATVTAVRMPDDLDSSELVRRVRERDNILISGGQGDLKGRIFRIGHLGTCRLDDLVATVAAVAENLAEMGCDIDAASAVAAARDAFVTCRENSDG
jgi:aspartate aminotransferase-like enzyme